MGFGALAYDPMTGLQIGADQPDPATPVVVTPQGGLSKAIGRLTGTQFGEPRMQTWPEKLIRSAVTLPGDVMSGEQSILPPGLRREDYTDAPPPSGLTVAAQPNDPAYERAQDLAGMAGGGMMFGRLAPSAGEAAAATVAPKSGAAGARPAASLLADSATPGAPIAALEHAPKFYSAAERVVEALPQTKMAGDQWLGTLNNRGVKPEEMDWTGLRGYLAERGSQPVTKAQVAEHLGANKLELGEVHRGDLKFDEKSPYALPEVVRAAREAGETPGDLELTLANDGNAYRALTKKFPELSGKEDWAEIVSKSVFGGDTMPAGTTKFQDYQLPGGENYREKLLTLPSVSVRKNAKDRWETVLPDGTVYSESNNQRNAQRIAQQIAKKNEEYRSSHWDEPNVLVHRRTNEREMALPATAEEMAAAEAHKVAKPDLDALRRQQDATMREISSTVAPLRKAREDQIRADMKARKISSREGLRALEGPFQHPEIVPLQERLQRLRAQEDAIRAGLPPEPKPRSAKTLHIEEIQSDWHQAGRKEGYGSPESGFRTRDKNGNEINFRTRDEAANSPDRDPRAGVMITTTNPVPDAPFKKNWHELALKDAIREAAEKGFDRISWTPGEAQAARYDLSKQISELHYAKNEDGSYWLQARRQGSGETVGLGDKIAAKELPNIIGKEMAEKIVDGKVGTRDRVAGRAAKIVDAEGLKIGGEGMRGFYDKMIPDALNKIGKPHGVKVERGEVEAPVRFGATEAARARNKDKTEKHPVHYMDIPQSLKDQALKKGFSLFEDAATTGAPLAATERSDRTAAPYHALLHRPASASPATAYHALLDGVK